jgi:hypothetical protein
VEFLDRRVLQSIGNFLLKYEGMMTSLNTWHIDIDIVVLVKFFWDHITGYMKTMQI